MDPILFKSLEAKLKECEMKIQAILDVLQLELQYHPEEYKLVQPQEEGESE